VVQIATLGLIDGFDQQHRKGANRLQMLDTDESGRNRTAPDVGASVDRQKASLLECKLENRQRR
jgi:hypothetical protein